MLDNILVDFTELHTLFTREMEDYILDVPPNLQEIIMNEAFELVRPGDGCQSMHELLDDLGVPPGVIKRFNGLFGSSLNRIMSAMPSDQGGRWAMEYTGGCYTCVINRVG